VVSGDRRCARERRIAVLAPALLIAAIAATSLAGWKPGGDPVARLPQPGQPRLTARDVSFEVNSATISHRFLPLELGVELAYAGYGTARQTRLDVTALAMETIDGVNTLKVRVSSDTATGSDQKYYWYAQDSQGNVWVLQKSADGQTTTYGRGGALLDMPVSPEVGSLLTEGQERVVAVDVTVPKLRTGLGPYSGCVRTVQESPDGDIDYFSYAPGVGLVWGQFDDGGETNGLELRSVSTGHGGQDGESHGSGCFVGALLQQLP
jgi:hypothetical protein